MPRGRPTEIPEDALLDAARDLLLEKGLRATTAGIAARAGVSEGLVFYRYRNKDALLAAVLKRQDRVPPRLEELAATAGQGSLEGNLQEIGRLVLTSARSVHPLIELIHSSPAFPRLRRLLSGPEAGPFRIIACVERYFAGEIAARRLRALSANLLARTLFGAVLDRVLSSRLSKEKPGAGEDDAFVSGLADLLLRGTLLEGTGRRAPDSRPRRGSP